MSNLGIYIEINGQCIPNGTYIEDSDLHIGKNSNNRIKCVLPGKRLNGGQWLRPDGQPVNCSDRTFSDPFQCFSSSSTTDAIITLYLYRDTYFNPGTTDPYNIETEYKCCLPYSCSDPNTEIMIINVFGRLINSKINLEISVFPFQF